ncbi:hypothetical protein C7271_17650 [filamentous cyanobacterium CCP5]|nr:hypothetical protein C7271_17650 [filamentous cyanobacterium CCP5]
MSGHSVSQKYLQYLLLASLILLVAIATKALLAWAAEVYLYSVPVLGGWLKSLELIELSNIVVFALLGIGLGAATVYLRPGPMWRGAITLIIAMPLVFFTSYWVRYDLWLQRITTASNLPPTEAAAIANEALASASDSKGFWGYFRATTQMPVLPTTHLELQTMTADQQWFRSELTRYSGLEPGIFSILFTAAGWGIRAFHIVLALLTGVIYFIKGTVWADGARLRRLVKKTQ